MREKIKILLIEDVVLDADLIELELTKADVAFESRRAETGEEFTRALTKFSPDIILSDYALPRFGAIEALRILKEMPVRIPFILVTGAQSEEVAVECMREGADDYILKASLKRLPSAVLNAIRKTETEREKAAAETAFLRREEQYRLITENTLDLVSLLDLEGRFLYVSPSYQRVLGHVPEELLGRSFTTLIHPGDLNDLKKTIEESRFFREARNAETRFRHQANRWQNFEARASHIFDEHGRAQRVLLVSRDIADRKRADAEIQRLAAFPRFNPNPVIAFAADGTLIYYNEAAQAMAKSVGKNHPKEILPLNTSGIVKMGLSTGQSKIHLDTNFGRRTISWSFAPIPANQIVHCWAEDITDRLNLESQLRQSQRLESVGQLAAGVAHDFNNILTIVQGHADLLSILPELSAPAAESVKQISLAAERAATLTRQLLTFSRKQVMQPQLLDLNEVVKSVHRMVKTLVCEQIILQVDLTRDLPAVHADSGMLEQIIVNLAVNARDAMENGGQLTITTSAVEIDEAYQRKHSQARTGSFVCLSVTDTGCGMSAETLGHIFEPFFTTKEIGKGTGLGLATVYGIVKQHSGWIEVASELDHGTTFKIYFPASAKSARARGQLSGRNAVRGGTETILAVEDEEALRGLVQEILQGYGYRVLDAASGAQALSVWQRHKDHIDLLFTDMMMPEGVSGRELAQMLTAEKSGLKVIYTSGYSVDVVAKDFSFQEGLNFLQKPYHPETLAQTIRNCLDN